MKSAPTPGQAWPRLVAEADAATAAAKLSSCRCEDNSPATLYLYIPLAIPYTTFPRMLPLEQVSKGKGTSFSRAQPSFQTIMID